MGNFLTHFLLRNKNLSIVFDGALVEDIASLFDQYHIPARPLFRKSTARDLLLAGPWLVDAGSSRSQQDEIVALAESYGDAVCWIGGPGADALYFHLRQLNGVRMPDDRFVYFRHYDPDVLASIAPLLDEEQASKLFGPTSAVAFVGGSSHHAIVRRPLDLPASSPGPIKFHDWQVQELDDRQREICRTRIAEMLRSTFPKATAGLSHEMLKKDVLNYEITAKDLGLSTELSFARWAKLNIMTDGKIADSAEIKKFRKNSPSSKNTDEWLDSNFDRILDKYSNRLVSSS